MKKEDILRYLKTVRIPCNQFRHTTPIDDITLKTVKSLLEELEVQIENEQEK